jgi:hypothetical protein
MRAAIPRLLVAVILFAAAALAWREAALARRVADAHSRLATLHFDVDDRIAEDESPLNQAVPQLSLDEEIRQHRAYSDYWRLRADNGATDTILALPGARGGNQADTPEAADPEVMFVATNTAFRSATRQTTDRPRTVERLDTVIQAYGEVLRSDPANVDAAYNYEYAVRVRDTIARGRNTAARGRKTLDDELGASVDLPPGPTIHGRPGGPPPEIPGDQFRTIAPMPYEEREESDPGRGPSPQRRG